MNILLLMIYIISTILLIAHTGYQCTENMLNGKQIDKNDMTMLCVSFIPLVNFVVTIFIIGMYIKLNEIEKHKS